VELFASARQTHIQKSSLFLEAAGFVRTHPVRQKVFLDPRKKDNIKLQALSGVKRHQRYRSGLVGEVISRGHQ
jgi:hypothetical protein